MGLVELELNSAVNNILYLHYGIQLKLKMSHNTTLAYWDRLNKSYIGDCNKHNRSTQTDRLQYPVHNILPKLTWTAIKRRKPALHHPSDIRQQSDLVNSLAGIITRLWRHEHVLSGVCDPGHWDSSQWRRR